MSTLTIRKSIFVAVLVIGAGILAACNSVADDTQAGAAGSGPTSPPSSSASIAPSPGTSASRTYVFKTLDPRFDSKYRITMDLLDGYEGAGGGDPVVFGTDGGQGISTWTVGNVYAEPCRWVGTLLDPPIDASVDGLVTGLASQKSRYASTATDVMLDGFTGKYMELTAPSRVHLADCNEGQFRTWLDPVGGARYLEPGQRDLLWIVDVDGSRLVIDAVLGPETTPRDRADRIQMVEGIRIEPI